MTLKFDDLTDSDWGDITEYSEFVRNLLVPTTSTIQLFHGVNISINYEYNLLTWNTPIIVIHYATMQIEKSSVSRRAYDILCELSLLLSMDSTVSTLILGDSVQAEDPRISELDHRSHILISTISDRHDCLPNEVDNLLNYMDLHAVNLLLA